MSEILAPCGGYESLFAALNSGADAVYVGMKSFSARKNAENFSFDELKKACRECHRRGARLYVALNTLVHDYELADMAECIRSAALCGADGLIVQDLGVMETARRICPGMPLHASTQMTLNSAYGVKAAGLLGFKRAVIGRELSFSEIKRIAENAGDIELEMFVHGALCVSISGQCHMSALFGGRSGNRGLCAQPCRLDFSCGERHNVLSLKDCSLVDDIERLRDIGISSFKIEGRMKRPEYVACAVNSCYKALCKEEYDKERLSGIFSRGGLTRGYYDGSMRDMGGIREKEDVLNSARALQGIKAIYKDELPRFPVNIRVTAKKGAPITAYAQCHIRPVRPLRNGGYPVQNEGNIITVSAKGITPETAKGAPITADDIAGRMSKLGGTPFFAGNVTVEADEGLYLPASALNSLRRELCGALMDELERVNTPEYELFPYSRRESAAPDIKREPSLRAEVSTAQQLKQALSLPFEMVYAPMELSEELPGCDRICVTPPLVLSDCEEEVSRRLHELRERGFTHGAAHTLAHALLLKECGFKVHGGFRMNILNSVSAGVCKELGFEDITLSFEGKLSALSKINRGISKGVVAYGRLPLMALRRCPIANGKPHGSGCLFEGDFKKSCGGTISDRRGAKIPVLCHGNSVELLNPDILVLSDKQSALTGFDFVIFRYTDEKELASALNMYKNAENPEKGFTRGLYFKGSD